MDQLVAQGVEPAEQDDQHLERVVFAGGGDRPAHLLTLGPETPVPLGVRFGVRASRSVLRLLPEPLVEEHILDNPPDRVAEPAADRVAERAARVEAEEVPEEQSELLHFGAGPPVLRVGRVEGDPVQEEGRVPVSPGAHRRGPLQPLLHPVEAQPAGVLPLGVRHFRNLLGPGERRRLLSSRACGPGK